MKIGIVSDSHGNEAKLRLAVAALCERGAELLVHCGDVGSAGCVETLGESGVPAYVVAGNTDSDVEALELAAGRCGVHFCRDVIEVPLDAGRRLAALHGHHPHLLRERIEGGQFAYVCVGHTHFKGDRQVGPTRVINPGALHRAFPATAALLDTAAETVEYLVI